MKFDQDMYDIVPSASATALTTPATTESAMSPSAPPPPRVVPAAPRTPPSHAHVISRPPARSGATKPQKPKAIAAPVTAAARNPASDLRGARGRRRRGTRAGSLLVDDPYKRPMVDAAVSAHERLYCSQ